jgi:O-antigen ligase
MSIAGENKKDHKPLSSSGKPQPSDVPGLRPPPRTDRSGARQGLTGLSGSNGEKAPDDPWQPAVSVDISADIPDATQATAAVDEIPATYEPKKLRRIKKAKRDRELLTSERWLVRNGHSLTYAGLFLFSIMVLFRPYELVPGLEFLSSTAVYFAIATLAIFIPSQLATEGNLSNFSTEVKAILAMTVIALFTIPIAKDPVLAWDKFNDPYIKAVVIFIVLVNVVRTRRRLMGMMWLSFGIGIYLSYAALDLYLNGKFTVEDYRVAVDVGGMFGNPNEMAMHFVMMTPLVIVLGIAARGKVLRWTYFGMAVMFVAANMVTYSRGGFLGLLGCSIVLAWKLGRKYRLNVTLASIVVGSIAIVAAPGNYGLRMLSIFVPGLDAVGSSDQRRELLQRSLLVTARNPWGIGIGNFPIVGVRNLQTHNAFTQVSSELGILGLIAYLVFMISPYRKLSAIERTLFDQNELNWFYYLSIGLQASIIGYMVSSFFASVAYNWFIYYLIAYAVAFRRIYSIREESAAPEPRTLWHSQPAEQAA